MTDAVRHKSYFYLCLYKASNSAGKLEFKKRFLCMNVLETVQGKNTTYKTQKKLKQELKDNIRTVYIISNLEFS